MDEVEVVETLHADLQALEDGIGWRCSWSTECQHSAWTNHGARRSADRKPQTASDGDKLQTRGKTPIATGTGEPAMPILCLALTCPSLLFFHSDTGSRGPDPRARSSLYCSMTESLAESTINLLIIAADISTQTSPHHTNFYFRAPPRPTPVAREEKTSSLLSSTSRLSICGARAFLACLSEASSIKNKPLFPGEDGRTDGQARQPRRCSTSSRRLCPPHGYDLFRHQFTACRLSTILSC